MVVSHVPNVFFFSLLLLWREVDRWARNSTVAATIICLFCIGLIGLSDGWSGSQPHQIRLSFMQRTQCIQHGLHGTRLGTEEATTQKHWTGGGDTVFSQGISCPQMLQMSEICCWCLTETLRALVGSPDNKKETQKRNYMEQNVATSNCTIFTLNDNIGNAFNSVACA